MYRRSGLVLSLLLLSILACGGTTKSDTVLGDLTVTPAQGRGTFTVVQNIDWGHASDELNDVICGYDTDAAGPNNQRFTRAGGAPIKFTFTMNTPGTYSVDCAETKDHGASRSAQYVVEEDTAGEPAGGQDFTKATLSIQWATMTADQGDKVNIFTCGKTTNTSVSQIELDVIALSALAGDCTFSTGDSGQSPIMGSVTGSWNPDSGEITFRLTSQMKVIGKPVGEATWVVTVANDGPVTFAAPDEAHGTAVWTNTCDADPDVTCYDRSTHKQAGGEVQWTMKFTK